MQKVLSADFNAARWERHGVNWMRSAKAKGYVGLVLDYGLPAEAKAKISELKFRCVSPVPGPYGKYFSIANSLKEGEKCLSAPVDFEVKNDFFDDDRLACCPDKNANLAGMVVPIVRLKKRAEAANIVEQTILPAHGSLLDTTYLCADRRNWLLLCGLLSFFVGSEFLDVRCKDHERIVLNLFATYFPARVKVIK